MVYQLSAAIGVTGENLEDCTYYCISKRQQFGQDTWFEFQKDDYGQIGHEDVFDNKMVSQLLLYTRQ